MVININDDRMIMEFLSGRYLGVPDGHAVYMNYPLTGLLAWLYKLLPNTDWYGYFLLAVMCSCIGLIVYRIMENRSKKQWFYGLAALGICAFAMGREFFSITYTTVAAISGATTVFWYGTSKDKKSDVMITAILAALTWCIRDELFLLIVPASGLIWLWKELPEEKKFWKKLILPFAVFGSLAVCIVVNNVMYSEEEWKEYQRFNELRTEIFDYQDAYYFPNYEEYAEYYERLGITNEERRMLIYYNFLLVNDEIGREEAAALFEKMIEIRGEYGVNEELLPLRQRIPMETKAFIKYTVTGAYGAVYNAAVVGFVVLIGWLTAHKKWRKTIEAISFLAVGMGMMLVMQIRGRMPDRVVYSLALVLFVTMVLNYLWSRWEFCQHEKIVRPALLGTVTMLSFVGLWNCGMMISENQQMILNQQELQVIQSYCQENYENFYFVTGEVLDEYGDVISSPIKSNKQLNYISTGDWISYSPIEEEKLSQQGIYSVAEALLEAEAVYLISVEDSVNLRYITNYLSQRSEKEVLPVLQEKLTEEYVVYTFE